LSTIRQKGDIMVDMPEFCYFWYYVLQGNVATRYRCGGK